MSDFKVFFQMGFDHLTDPGGLDHVLFLLCLASVFAPREWRRLLILATAFTIGHSLSLAVTVLWKPILDGGLVEMLIPLTIIATAAVNLARPVQSSNRTISYLLALGFGVIHGFGFAGYLRSMLTGIRDDLIGPLLYFNIGLEAAQILLLLLYLPIALLALRVLKIPQSWWARGLNIAIIIAAVYLFVMVLLEQ